MNSDFDHLFSECKVSPKNNLGEVGKGGDDDQYKKALEECLHSDLVDENGTVICIDCGEEIKKVISYEKEWRYYGSEDTRRNADPSRCQIRRIEDKSIYRDVETLGFSEKITNGANDIYSRVTKGKIYRGKFRKSIVFACIFNSYKLSGKPITCEKLQEIFKLDKKVILRGLKFVTLNVPKDSQIRTTHITPVELIEEIINRTGIPPEDKSQIIEIYVKVKNRSSLLNRSRPQSFAAGLIYFWIIENNKDVNIKEFIKKVKLSELTVSKISREINRIIS